MRQRKGPPVKKFSYYITPEVGQAYTDFAGDAGPSTMIDATELVWLGLPAEARERAQVAARERPVAKAIASVYRIVQDAMADQILLDYARSLPKAERARIIQKSLEKR